MNFIDAHMIVHNYAGSLAKGASENAIIYRPISYLVNTKDEIIDALKLFYAHMIFFNTRTQEEYEQYELARKCLNYFIDDAKYYDVINCNKIINSKSLFEKWRNKTALPFAKEKVNEYLSEISNMMANPFRGEEVEEYFLEMQTQCAVIKERITVEKREQGSVSNKTYYECCNNYCCVAYEKAHLVMEEMDIEYFYSFDILRYFLTRPNLNDLFENYAGYISTNK